MKVVVGEDRRHDHSEEDGDKWILFQGKKNEVEPKIPLELSFDFSEKGQEEEMDAEVVLGNYSLHDCWGVLMSFSSEKKSKDDLTEGTRISESLQED